MHYSTILTLNDVKDHFDLWRATRTNSLYVHFL